MTNKQHFTIQMVKHVNYTAFVEASSMDEAEQLAAENTADIDWVQMIGPQPTEICCEDGTFIEGDWLE